MRKMQDLLTSFDNACSAMYVYVHTALGCDGRDAAPHFAAASEITALLTMAVRRSCMGCSLPSGYECKIYQRKARGFVTHLSARFHEGRS